MLSLMSVAAVAGTACWKDYECEKGEYCRVEPPARIARACVERDEYEVDDWCRNDLAHCCPQGTTCEGFGWWKKCKPVMGECVPKGPEACCMAFPGCKLGFERDEKGVCTEADFASGRCVKEAMCCQEITCVKTDKKLCELSCGTQVPSGWSGKDEGANYCNRCWCEDGALGCTRMGCGRKRGCPTTPVPAPVEKKSCELSCGTVVPHGWSGKGEGENHCNQCWCANGAVACTKMACSLEGGRRKYCPCNEFTEPLMCIALEGVCYNAGGCSCGHYEKAQCLVEPCSVNSCPKGYKCQNNYCGGCHHQCVKEVA